MKASELRIGNLVYETINNHNEEVVKITSLSDMLIGWSPYRNTGHHNHIKPIPLTEEWLLKFGFFSKYKSCNVRWNILGFDIQQKSDEDDYGNKIPQEQVFYFNYMYDIKYVHQLQNLYFALTGEELTLIEKS